MLVRPVSLRPGPEMHQKRVDRAADVLLATPPPLGWRPLGPDDELLLALLPDEEA